LLSTPRRPASGKKGTKALAIASLSLTTCWGIQENTSPSKRRSLTAFSKYVFQEQGIREFRKSGTCEVSNSRVCRIREL
jgi:hypothetical protein